MKSPFVIFLIGSVVFLAHLFSALFSRKMIPDVLLLMLLGWVVGPLCGLVSVDDFGAVGPIFSILTLLVILFQESLDIDFRVIKQSLKSTLILSIVNFVITVGVMSGMVMAVQYWGSTFLEFVGLDAMRDLDFKEIFLLGTILGATSIAVIVPLLQKLNVQAKTKSMLLLEATLGEVLTIVIFFMVLNLIESGYFHLGMTSGKFVSSILVAVAFGIGAGCFWSIILNEIRIIQNSVFTTPAFIFVLFGITELFGFSGVIAVLSFGATLGNIELFNLSFLKKYFPKEPIKLNEAERSFIAEVVFLFKTFFFIYMGISLELSHSGVILCGFIFTLFMFGLRIPVIRFCISKETTIFDASIMAILIPRGLVAAVLAAIPLQRGIAGGEVIQMLVYSIVFFSILFTSLLIFFLDRPYFYKLYGFFFRHFSSFPKENQ